MVAALQQILVVLLGLPGLAVAAQVAAQVLLVQREQPTLAVAVAVEVPTGHPPLLVALAAPALS